MTSTIRTESTAALTVGLMLTVVSLVLRIIGRWFL
jgi:hypothetical protein